MFRTRYLIYIIPFDRHHNSVRSPLSRIETKLTSNFFFKCPVECALREEAALIFGGLLLVTSRVADLVLQEPGKSDAPPD